MSATHAPTADAAAAAKRARATFTSPPPRRRRPRPPRTGPRVPSRRGAHAGSLRPSRADQQVRGVVVLTAGTVLVALPGFDEGGVEGEGAVGVGVVHAA